MLRFELLSVCPDCINYCFASFYASLDHLQAILVKKLLLRSVLLCEKCTDRSSHFSFGSQKNAIAVAHCKKGAGILKVNGNPLELLQPETLRYKIFEPVLLVGREKFQNIDIRVRVKGGGHTSQVYGEFLNLLRERVSIDQSEFVQPFGKQLQREL